MEQSRVAAVVLGPTPAVATRTCQARAHPGGRGAPRPPHAGLGSLGPTSPSRGRRPASPRRHASSTAASGRGAHGRREPERSPRRRSRLLRSGASVPRFSALRGDGVSYWGRRLSFLPSLLFFFLSFPAASPAGAALRAGASSPPASRTPRPPPPEPAAAPPGSARLSPAPCAPVLALGRERQAVPRAPGRCRPR